MTDSVRDVSLTGNLRKFQLARFKTLKLIIATLQDQFDDLVDVQLYQVMSISCRKSWPTPGDQTFGHVFFLIESVFTFYRFLGH